MKFHAPMFCDSSWHQTMVLAFGNCATAALSCFLVERVKLLDADDRRVGDLVLFAELQQVVIDLAGAEDHALDLLRLVEQRAGQDFVEAIVGEVLDLRRRGFEAQHDSSAS